MILYLITIYFCNGVEMFDLLQRFKNVRDGIFVLKHLTKQLESRDQRQKRQGKIAAEMFRKSIMSQGVGYCYDFRNLKRRKPSRKFYG